MASKLKDKLKGSVSVIYKDNLGIANFPATAEAACNSWQKLLTEAYGLGYQYQGQINQVVGPDVKTLIVFQEVKSEPESIAGGSQAKKASK